MPSIRPQSLQVIVLGAGITGLSVALALTKYFPSYRNPKIIILEVRPVPSTIGGAINLIPSALRYLNHIGVLPIIKANNHGAEIDTIDLFNVYTGGSIGAIDFRGPSGDGFGEPPFKARRLMRGELLQALLEAVGRCPNIEVRYGSKTRSIEETESSIILRLDDGSTLAGDILLGCDGIHSAARALHIEPERKPEYTGIAVAMSSSVFDEQGVPFKDTALCSSRRGSLMASYFEPSRTMMYIAAVMQTPEVQSREGWKAKGEAQEVVRKDILERFESEAMPSLKPLVEGVKEWFLYPVYKLPPKGKWATERAILLGDAAHAMPPQGESAGIALEDAIIFARTLALHTSDTDAAPSIADLFNIYESLRRRRIDAAHDEAVFRWETVKDSGWLGHRIKMWLTPWFIWWTGKTRAKGFEEDLGVLEIKVANTGRT